MTEGPPGLAACRLFGTVPGRVPGLPARGLPPGVGVQRARVAVALARAWVYGADPARAVPFAEEAVAIGQDAGDAVLLADALDAQLLVHWGPDDLAERVRITRRLEDTVSPPHRRRGADDRAPLAAHHRAGVPRPARDAAAAAGAGRAGRGGGVGRVRFFAAARRGMYALLTGDVGGAAGGAAEIAVASGAEAGEADTLAIERTLARRGSPG